MNLLTTNSNQLHLKHDFPCDPTSLVKWRKRIGSEGVEKF
ncbi:hypothetical protein LEP1GSC024_2143 [Leptospira noguchii str. 2001034031]|uniref:Transposase n=1 Tax=Leptospira noguchii str. 2001034031 TaxID=1193053 RepID=M6YJL8_9LEPT|nr:hypothetical protein LEP1GSC024_2143 [Leptospira noguchii str. 2001034031]